MASKIDLPQDFVLEFDQPVVPERASADMAPAVDDFQLDIVIPDASERGWMERNVTDPWNRGVQNTTQMLDTARVLLGPIGGLDAEGYADEIIESEWQKLAYPQTTDDQQAWQVISEAQGWDQAVEVAKRPQLWWRTFVESAPQTVGSVAAGTAGGLAGGAAGTAVAPGPGTAVGATGGAMAGTFVGSAAQEFNASVLDALKDEGVAGDAETLAAAVQDPEIMGRAKEYAAKRGLSVAAFDAISFALAGRVFGPVARRVGKTAGDAPGAVGAAAGSTAELGAQAAIGAAGETAAQVASTGGIESPAEIALEGLAEVPGAAIEIPGAVVSRMGQRQRQQTGATPGQETPGADVTQVSDFVLGDPETETETEFELDPEPETPAVDVDTGPQQVQVQPQTQQNTQPSTPQTQPSTPRVERVVTPDGEFETDTEFEIVEADSLRAAEGEVQPRDRATRVGSREQIDNISARLDPLRLTSSRESDRGAPVVDEESTILSGNGRVASIIKAAEDHPERYQAYRTTLEQMGYATDGLKTPVLIRRARGVDPDNKRRFAVQSNQQGGLALSASEQARIEQDYVSDDMLAGFNSDVDDGVDAGANADFVRRFLSNVPQGERGAFYTTDGQLSTEGSRRIKAALFARAYGNPRLVDQVTETDEGRAYGNALTAAAPEWARMRENAPDFDITESIVEALGIIKDAQAKGLNVKNYLAQQDAFRQISERTEKALRLLQNEGMTRQAAWRDVRDRMREYAQAALSNSRAEGDLMGNRPGPDETLDNIVNRISQREDEAAAAGVQRAPEGDSPTPGADVELFPTGQTLSTGPKRGGRGGGDAQAQRPAAGLFDQIEDEPDVDVDVEDAGDGGAEIDTPDATTSVPSRKPTGTLTPQTQERSYTNRRSIYEEAFRAAGMDPDKGVLLPAGQKRNVLSRLLRQTFGFVDINFGRGRTKSSAKTANDQMLDAYRNVRFMMHVLGLPIKGVSLDGTLSLSLERVNSSYYGVYRPDLREVGLPGRSNSFAHEWAHALDHWLVDRLNKNPNGLTTLLSIVTRNDGLDVTSNVEEAFVRLIHTMFYDEADLAAQMLRLENEAGKTKKDGTPTKAALDARKRLERLASGATRIKIKPTDYRANSQDYDPSGYFPSVHEMLARAFEAYVATKVEAVGGTNEFITKGEEAYLSDADQRLAMTFPKGEDRVRIFAAFDELMQHLRQPNFLGTGTAAMRPGDTDIIDPQHWNKVLIEQGEDGLLKSVVQEGVQVRNALQNAHKNGVLKSIAAAFKNSAARVGVDGNFDAREYGRKMADTARFLVYSTRHFLKPLIKRNEGQGGAIMQDIFDRIITGPGEGNRNVQTFEEERDQETQKQVNKLWAALKGNGVKTLTEEQNNTLRDLLLGKNVPGAEAALVKVAAAFRRVFDDTHSHAERAGVEVGYVSDTGYLPRSLNLPKVMQNAEKFRDDAVSLYRKVYDRLTDKIGAQDMLALATRTYNRVQTNQDSPTFKPEIDALKAAMKEADKATTAQEKADAAKKVRKATADLKDAVREDYALLAGRDWKERVIRGDSFAYDSHGPDAQFTQNRTLPPEADDIMAEWYETDVSVLAVNYVHSAASRAAYVRRFGNSGGVADLEALMRRKDVKDRMARNPRAYNPKTEQGLRNILKLANPRTDNILELNIAAATRLGANGDDLRSLRGAVESVTGRETRGAASTHGQRASSFVVVTTYLTLLPRAALTSIAEPTAIMLRTGNVKASFETFKAYLGEAVRGAKTTQDRAALARAIGVVSTPLYDEILMNRLGVDFQHMVSGNAMMARFFRMNFLTPLTNAQRRAVMAGGFAWMRDLGEQVLASDTDAAQRKRIEAELRELGIKDAEQADFAKWLTQMDTPPTLDDLNSKGGAIFERAMARFVDQTIQNPRRGDKPMLASTPMGRMVFSLTSFLYAFFQNVHLATIERAKRNYRAGRETGQGRVQAAYGATGRALWSLGAGFSAAFVGQMVATMAREALFSTEQWEEKFEEDELYQWLVSRAFSRTGVGGPFDVLLNAVTGLKYERDLTSLMTGAGPSYMLGQFQNILRGMGVTGRNSPNTNTAEREMWKSVYRLTVSPAAVATLSALDAAGPFGATGRYFALTGLTSNSAADAFATALVGEEGE